jgi:hypothetical protein
MQAYDPTDKPVSPIMPFDKKKMEKYLLKPEVAHVRVFMLQKGMEVTVKGARYKVTAARPNGKVTMKFMGAVKLKTPVPKAVSDKEVLKMFDKQTAEKKDEKSS